MKRFLIMLALIGFCATSFAQDEHKRAKEHYNRGEYKDALALLEESIQTYPDWWFPILLKGQCNQKLGKHEEALRNYNDALTLEVPTNVVPQVRFYIAKTYMEAKDYKKAVAAFTEAAPLVPASIKFDIFFSRGQCEMQIAKAAEDKDQGNAKSYYSKAIVSFTEALKHPVKQSKLSIEASYQKAYAQSRIGNISGGIKSLEDSIRAFQDVISRDPKEKRAHATIINLQLEIINASKGDAKVAAYNKVVEYLDRYLANWPKDDDKLIKKALSLQGAKRYKEAISVCKLILKSQAKNGEIWFTKGSCEMADKQFNAAITSLENARKNGQDKNPQVYSFIANCYNKQKNNCYANDIPLEKKAVAVLEQGVNALSGQHKSLIQKEYERKKNNLNILTENLATDNKNHLTAVTNIRELSKTIGANTQKLQKNRDMYIEQPTDDLRAAIDKGQKTIDEDKKNLEEQYKALNDYIKAIKKCGDTESYKHYNDMVALMKTRQ